MALVSAPGSYIYVCTRLRVRRSFFLPREDLLRMLHMELPEIIRFIGETTYKKEIAELATLCSGTDLDLLEMALSWNMAKEFHKIQEIIPDGLRGFTSAYLRRWDVQNVINIMRGKAQGMKAEKIKEVLIPAGDLDREFLDRLLAEDSVEKVAAALSGVRFYPLIKGALASGITDESLMNLENELIKQYYRDLIEEAGSGVKGGKVFLDWLRMEIDFQNIENLFRLRHNREKGDVLPLMIPGGRIPVEELVRLNGIEDRKEFIDELRKRAVHEPLQAALEEFRKEKPIHEIEIALTRALLAQMAFLAKMHPFSIYPVLTYLEEKRYEVANIRTIARGKKVNLPAEEIKGYLVI
ncbi:MAG TPA: V-type ATP synthase subunit C [Methanomicrobiales archaeon]|nr:V-type ATP synthase subunit C [Methanomicrobiales archaeon]